MSRSCIEVCGIGLAALTGMPSDTCPLCGTSVALLLPGASPAEADMLRERIETLRQRAGELEHGDVTPQQLKDDLLWMCTDCQRVMADLTDREEMQRRINDEVRRLEHGRVGLTRRAS